MTGLPVKAIFSSVTVYNKHVYSECNLLTQIEQVQDKIMFHINALTHQYLNGLNTVVSNHFHSVKILLFSSARSRDFDGM